VTGAPVASGTVEFFVPGSTSEYVDAFTDYEETEEHTQPITLDAAGRAEVYLSSQAEIVVKTSTGAASRLSENGESVSIAQVDVGSLSGWTGPELTDVLDDIADSIGPDAQYQESTSTGCVARNVNAVLKQFVSPYDFGAVGNGTADDTTPLQRAINRAVAIDLPLNLEAGTYRVTGLTIGNPLNIYGAGTGKAIITMAAESADAIDLNITGAGLLDSFEWRDFSVTVPYDTGAGYAAIHVTSAALMTLSRLHLEGTIGVRIAYDVDDSVNTAYMTDSVISNCSAKVSGSSGTTGVGFMIGTRCLVQNCKVDGNSSNYTYGFSFVGQQGLARGCYASNAARGFSWDAGVTQKGTADSCFSDTCTLDYRPYGLASHITRCRESGSTTVVTNGATSQWSGGDNSWTEAETAGFVRLSSSSSTPSLTFDPTKPTNIVYLTYSGSVTSVTVGMPASPVLIPFSRYKVIIQSGASTTVGSVTFSGTGMATFAATITLSASSYATFDFSVSSNGTVCPVGSANVFNTLGNLWGA
jgi:hypothetical protein